MSGEDWTDLQTPPLFGVDWRACTKPHVVRGLRGTATRPTLQTLLWRPVPAVIPGDQAAGVTAVLSLLDAGHRRIGYIGGKDSIEAPVERQKGYRRALATRDVPYDPALVVKGGHTIAGGYRGMKRLLALPDPPAAVFCFCDRTAQGVYIAAAEAGLTIGRDLSVIGFDNLDHPAKAPGPPEPAEVRWPDDQPRLDRFAFPPPTCLSVSSPVPAQTVTT